MVLSLYHQTKYSNKMEDWLLIGIKDGKWSFLAQAGKPNIPPLAKEIKKKLGTKAFDNYIMVPGNIVNV
jgi:hypothetical protein